MWRFKTEKEFIQEFGKDWKSTFKVGWNNAGCMDHLFGWTPTDKIDQEKINIIMKKKVVDFFCMKNNTNEDMNWTYTSDMFIQSKCQLEFDI